jgi:hypothetical protein
MHDIDFNEITEGDLFNPADNIITRPSKLNDEDEPTPF